jgi:hypothetical protein
MEWLPAFKAAGFDQAIEVKDAPVDDANWDSYSVNHSIIRWTNDSEVRGKESLGGATVSHVIDMRSGEILKSDIFLNSSFQSLSDPYLVRCAPLDRRAQKYPFADDLMGELIQYVTAHEAGHSFGIKDANFGEYAYPFENMRNKKWLESMGHTPSIMSYGRHNYIVQPEDNIPPALLIQKVGPNDIYHIKWGYTDFGNGDNIAKDQMALEELIGMQDSILWYRYNNDYSRIIGPSTTHNVVESDDPIESTTLGLKNIERVIALLPQINLSQNDNRTLGRLYNETLELWYLEMQHVLSLVGGYTIQYKSGTQFGDVYTPIPRHIQKEALAFLLQNAFEVPTWLSHPKFLSRIQYSTNSDKLLDYQLKLMAELLDPDRMKRLEEMEKYPDYMGIIKELISDLKIRLFNQLFDENIEIDARKQELQYACLSLFINAVQQQKNYLTINLGRNSGFFTIYLKTLFSYELDNISKQLIKCLEKVTDPIKSAGLELLQNHINTK